MQNTIAMCLRIVTCWLMTGLWNIASWARPLTAFVYIIPYKRFLTGMIGSTGHVEITTIGTRHKSLTGFTWLVVTIRLALTVRYTWARWARRTTCCWGGGGWWHRWKSCWWWFGWWASGALIITTFLHIIPHKRFLTGVIGGTGHVEIATIGTRHKSLAGFTWLVVTIRLAPTVRYTWARWSRRTTCCWGDGGWRHRWKSCWWWFGWWASRALVIATFLHIIPHKRFLTWVIGGTGHVEIATIGTRHKSLAGFTWLVVTIRHAPTVRYTWARWSRRTTCCWGDGGWRHRWKSCWWWFGWWASRALVITTFLHIIPHKRFLTGVIWSTGHVVIMTIGTGHKSLTGFTWLVVTTGHAAAVRHTWARCWGAGGWQASRTTCWWEDGGWRDRAGRALPYTVLLQIIPNRTGLARMLTKPTIYAGHKAIAKFAWLVVTIRHVPTVWDALSYVYHAVFLHIIPHFTGSASFLTEQTTLTLHIFLIGFTWWVRTIGHVRTIRDTWARCSSRTNCCWGDGGWVRRSTCWCWWGWWASRALVLTAFLHIIPHKRWITGSTGHVIIMTIGTGYKSLAGVTWLVVTIRHVATVRHTYVGYFRISTCWRGAGAWWVRRSTCWCWWGWWASRALVLTAFLHIIPHKRFFTGMIGGTGHVEITTIGTGHKSLAGFTWLVVTIRHAPTVRYTCARCSRTTTCCWGVGAWWHRWGSCWWWFCWWASRALVLTAFLHIIPHKRFLAWMIGSTGHVKITTIWTGYKFLACFAWLVVTVRHAATARDTFTSLVGNWSKIRLQGYSWKKNTKYKSPRKMNVERYPLNINSIFWMLIRGSKLTLVYLFKCFVVCDGLVLWQGLCDNLNQWYHCSLSQVHFFVK